MSLDESKIAHLGMIQGIIGRMSSDAQTMKTLAITITAAVVALAQTDNGAARWLTIAGIFAVVLFWSQTARHLHIERAYRHLYDLVREDKDVPPFSMNWREYREEVDGPFKVAFSQSVAVPFGIAGAILMIQFLVASHQCI